MKRPISLLLALAFVLHSGSAQTIKSYLHLRRQNRITQAVGVEALETLVGSRIVEVQGKVKGSFRVGGGPSTVLLEKSDGNTMSVQCPGEAPDWLSGNEVAVRMIVNAQRDRASSEIRATLLGAAPEGEISKLEEAAARRSGYGSRHSFGRAREYSLPASQATPIYAGFVKSRNRRLSDSEAYRIARGVVGYSLKYGVDARLIMAMVMVESGFNPNATSRTGAMGLGQLMPGTAAGMGVSDAYDSIDNLYGTVRLIRGHLENYRNQTGDAYSSLVLALAAYNAGSGAVARHGGVPPYRETQNYVRKVVSIYRALCGA